MRELKKELWPHRIKVNQEVKNDITSIEIWLGHRLGGFKGKWNVVYHHDCTVFYFKQEQDATLFALRWS